MVEQARRIRESLNYCVKYTDGPMGDVAVVKDFLPPPFELAFREETGKIRLKLSRASVDYFKKEAEIHYTPYQRMIRRLLDDYTEKPLPLAKSRSAAVPEVVEGRESTSYSKIALASKLVAPSVKICRGFSQQQKT